MRAPTVIGAARRVVAAARAAQVETSLGQLEARLKNLENISIPRYGLQDISPLSKLKKLVYL